MASNEHESEASISKEDQAKAWKDKGNTAFGQGNWAESVTAYTEGISFDPSNAILYSNRAACYLKMGKYEMALKDAERAVALDPACESS